MFDFDFQEMNSTQASSQSSSSSRPRAGAGAGLERNPDGCTSFEPNPFRMEKCKHCGLAWTLHDGAISEEMVERILARGRSSAQAKADAKAKAQQHARAQALASKKGQRAVEDNWLFDGKEDSESSSGESEGFRMMDMHILQNSREERSPRASIVNPQRAPMVRNLINFAECDLPVEPGRPSSSQQAFAQPSTPGQKESDGTRSPSPECVGANSRSPSEERDVTKQLMQRAELAEVEARKWQVEAQITKDRLKVEGQEWRQMIERLQAENIELARKLEFQQDEALSLRACLRRREASDLQEVKSISDLNSIEVELMDTFRGAMSHVQERRVELRLAAAAAKDIALCKICFDQPTTCALLPCKHHAFCMQCAVQVLHGVKPSCPLCRSPVDNIFETYSG